MVEVGKFPAPPHFSWKPCDETKGGGRKLNGLCVCVWECVLHVSCLGLTASLPHVKSFPGVVWFGLQLICFIDPRLFCTGTFPLSGFGSLSWIFSASVLLKCFSVGLFHLLTVFLGFVGRVCFYFYFFLLTSSPQSCMESVVCLNALPCHHLKMIRGVD